MGYKIEKLISAPLLMVWNAWVSNEQTQKWLAPKSNVNFKEGDLYEFFWDANPELNSTKGCRLRKIDDKKKLTFEWQGKTEFLEMFKPPFGPTIINVTFSTNEQGMTSVVLERTETRNFEKWAEYDNWMSSAWESALAELKKYLENELI